MSSDMLRCYVVIISLSWAVCAALAVPQDGDKKSRPIKNELSDEEHYLGEGDDEHNYEYDHEAFLGEDEARAFEQLTPEESQERLAAIVDKIDEDQDGFVTREELKNWIDYVQKKYIMEDVNTQWSSHNPKNKDEIVWEDYRSMVYGFIDNMDPKELEEDEEGMSYLDMMKRDKRRWETADVDKDGALSREEFADFLHPEESKDMKEVVVTETMEDIDKDKDGKISLDEYIGDMYKGDEDGEEPSWVNNEREQFNEFRDKNKDGFMDLDEVREWIIPPDYDHSEAEAKHLIFESDVDNDQKLTKTEILDKYDLFVGSQATDFGEALTRHDEF